MKENIYNGVNMLKGKKGKLLLIAVLLVGAGLFFAFSNNTTTSLETDSSSLAETDLSQYENVDELQSTTLEPGSGELAVQEGDTVTVHYEGYLTDGTKFDSSYERTQPATFTLQSGQLIEGWVQGVQDMKVGERRRLVIPPELGYGEEGTGPIPANATLVFDIELLDILRSDEGSN